MFKEYNVNTYSGYEYRWLVVIMSNRLECPLYDLITSSTMYGELWGKMLSTN